MEESLILNNQNQSKKLTIFETMIAELELWRRRQFSTAQYLETLIQQIVFGSADHGSKILLRLKKNIQSKDKKDFGSASTIFDIVKKKLQMSALEIKNQLLAIFAEIPLQSRLADITHQDTINLIYLAWLKIRSIKITQISIPIYDQGKPIMQQFIKEIDQVGQKIYKFWLILYQNAEEKNIPQIDMLNFIKQFISAIFADKSKSSQDDIQSKSQSCSQEEKCCVICGVYHTSQNSLHSTLPSKNHSEKDDNLAEKQSDIIIKKCEQLQSVEKQTKITAQQEQLHVQKCCLQKNFEDLKQDQQLLLRQVDEMIKEKQKQIEKEECWRSIMKECKDKCKLSRQKKCNCYERKISNCKRYLEKLKKQRQRLCLIENNNCLTLKIETDTKDNSEDDIRIKQQNQKNMKEVEPNSLKSKKKTKKQGLKKEQVPQATEAKHQNITSHKALIKDEQESTIYAYLTNMRLNVGYRSCCRVEQDTINKWKIMGQMYRKKDNIVQAQKPSDILQQKQVVHSKISIG